MTASHVSRERRLGPATTVLVANAALLAILLAFGPTVATALLVAAAGGLLISDRPQRGILLLVALTPFDGLLLLADHPTIVDGWKEALALVTLAATFVAPAKVRALDRREAPAWLLPVIGLLVLSVVSATAVGGLSSLVGLKIGFFYLVTAWAIWRCPLDAAERDRLVTILLAVGIVTAAYGVAQQVMGAPRLVALGYEYNTAVRFSGSFLRSFSTFVQPFGFGFYLMVVVLVALPGALRDPSRLRSRVLLWSMPLLIAGILSTVVRGAWLGLAVGVVYLAATRHRSLLLLLPIVFIAVLLLPPEIASSALSSTSSSERASGWSQNLHHVASRPFGSGVGSAGASAEKAAELSKSTDATTYQPDNQYFLTVYELGPIGLWLLALLFVAAFSMARRVARSREGPEGDIAAGVAALVVAVAAASTVSSFLQIFPMDVLWWVLLAVVACIATEPAKSA
jgi:hypothetical protein